MFFTRSDAFFVGSLKSAPSNDKTVRFWFHLVSFQVVCCLQQKLLNKKTETDKYCKKTSNKDPFYSLTTEI